MTNTTKTFLHVGCGQKTKENTTRGFNSIEWKEIRYDIDSKVDPDLIGSMTDLSEIKDRSIDAIFSSHNIEHLYPHEVPVALSEFLRVLKDDGFVVITCPDLQSVCELIAEDKLLEAAYDSPAGPISPMDMLYGYRPSMARGNLYMSHRCGFTKKVLAESMRSAGFQISISRRRPGPFFDLWIVSYKSEQNESLLRSSALEHFP